MTEVPASPTARGAAAPDTAPPDVVALFGPTAIGKTAIAIELADALRERGEDPCAVSVDSMQVYRELPLVTGAPGASEQHRLEHRLVGCVSARDTHDVVSHASLAHGAIDELRVAGRRPIVVGGTGLYLRAALTELDFLPPPATGQRERLEAELDALGAEALYARLEQLDPGTAAATDPTNARRLVRALEAVEQGASADSRSQNRLWTQDVRVPTRLFALVMDRDRLYEAIDRRVDAIVAAGAFGEVRRALEQGLGDTAAQALGVSELATGDIDALKANTRRYAKRQLTWLRKLPASIAIDVTGRSASSVGGEIADALTG